MSLLIGVGGLLLGAFALAWGYNRHSYHRVISETPTTRILDVDEPGRVELKGEVVPTPDGERNLQAPLSGDSCVAAGWEVEEWRESGKHSSWETVASGYDAVPFRVDDGSAEIRVEPGTGAESGGFSLDLPLGDLDHSVVVDDVTLDFDRLDVVHQVEPDDPTPARVEEFERRAPGLREQSGSIMNVIDIGNAHGERKYHEGIVQPGDDVYLLGTVEPKQPDVYENRRLRPDDAVVSPSKTGPFVLSTRSENELLKKSRWGRPAMAAGVVLLLVGAVSLLGFPLGALPV